MTLLLGKERYPHFPTENGGLRLIRFFLTVYLWGGGGLLHFRFTQLKIQLYQLTGAFFRYGTFLAVMLRVVYVKEGDKVRFSLNLPSEEEGRQVIWNLVYECLGYT